MGGAAAVVTQALFAGIAHAGNLPGIDILSSGAPIDTAVTVVVCEVAFYMFWILIALSVVFVLIAAYKYLTSSGDENKVSGATKTITFAAIAIVVALLAKGLPPLVGSLVGSSDPLLIC
ncbi:MAG: hypothetical protein A2945_01845 [Candidatus Liptonbacteria bacterium RIFCSPLOWO2_01_FULL_52_25]|uniref:Uncharacterized protein n=1 Tax=Candidatus Liptonbacteria bacterium RIFCSPLOWO2_01_FULL_52_25 TaxID=1798650 RepID=A0A1G2CE96_9BACT|nr:MAG: hypothetical protein A2945_01845 [Candidatus Liptonbacteria bacterium RIFCSPLOWO2_01_FULL_52_25]